jgi:hypothetical protein
VTPVTPGNHAARTQQRSCPRAASQTPVTPVTPATPAALQPTHNNASAHARSATNTGDAGDTGNTGRRRLFVSVFIIINIHLYHTFASFIWVTLTVHWD